MSQIRFKDGNKLNWLSKIGYGGLAVKVVVVDNDEDGVFWNKVGSRMQRVCAVIDLIKLFLLPLSADRWCVRVAMQREDEGKKANFTPNKSQGRLCGVGGTGGACSELFRVPKQAGQLNSVIGLQL